MCDVHCSSGKSSSDAAAAAGDSCGELAVLCAAGCFDFENGVRLAKARGEFMKVAASADGSERQKMVSLVGLDEDEVEDMCRTVVESHGGVCSIANRLFPCGVVVSGTEIAMDQLKASAKDRGAEKVSELKGEQRWLSHESDEFSRKRTESTPVRDVACRPNPDAGNHRVFVADWREVVAGNATDDKRRGFADWVDQPEQLGRCVPGDD